MTIATKGGLPLFVNGIAATNCGCCQPPCPCVNTTALPRNVHSVFAPGWACAPNHAPPDEITVRVEFTGESSSGWYVSGDARGPTSATLYTYTAPSPGDNKEYVLVRSQTGGNTNACFYQTPAQLIFNPDGNIIGYRPQGQITIHPGVLIGNGWDAVMRVAGNNPYWFYPERDVLGIYVQSGAQIPWANFQVGPGEDQLCSPDCVLSSTKSSSVFEGAKYSLFPLPLLEPNAKLIGFRWAFCYSFKSDYRTGSFTYASNARCITVAIISVV